MHQSILEYFEHVERTNTAIANTVNNSAAQVSIAEIQNIRLDSEARHTVKPISLMSY